MNASRDQSTCSHCPTTRYQTHSSAQHSVVYRRDLRTMARVDGWWYPLRMLMVWILRMRVKACFLAHAYKCVGVYMRGIKARCIGVAGCSCTEQEMVGGTRLAFVSEKVASLRPSRLWILLLAVVAFSSLCCLAGLEECKGASECYPIPRGNHLC